MSLEAIFDAVLKGDAEKARAETVAALEAGTPAQDILHKACIPAMSEVGQQFEAGEKYVPDMLISARAMQAGMNVLEPHLAAADVKALGTAVLGTVAGDLHDIGKNLVGLMLEGAGFDVIDLGKDVKPEGFVAAVREHQPDLIGMSALLTTTMRSMKSTMDALGEAGVRNQVKVIVGGAPITQNFADQVGADAYAPDASSAARKAKELLGVA